MTVLSVVFTKVSAEKKKVAQSGAMKINNQIGIDSVERSDLVMGKNKQPGMLFSFHYNVQYEPAVGSINIQGSVVFVESEENVEKILAEWKKNKKLDDDLAVRVINKILERSQLQALIMSKELSLPMPLQLPKASAKQEE